MQPTTPDPSPRPTRRRLWRTLLLLAVLSVGAFFLIPRLAAPFVRGRLEEAFAGEGGSCTIGGLSLGWDGSARLSDLLLASADGTPQMRIASAEVDVALMKAVGGSIEASLLVKDWWVQAVRQEDGSWSFEELLPTPKEGEGADRGASGKEGGDDEPPPDVRAKVTLEEGEIEFQDGDQRAIFVVTGASLDLVGLDKPAPLHLEGALSSSGSLALGSGTVEVTGELDPKSGNASLDLTFDGTKLALGDFEQASLGLESTLALSGDALGVEQLSLDSPALTLEASGALRGIETGEFYLADVKGQASYLPDALAPLLEGVLPGRFEGSERKQVELSFDGPLEGFQPEDLLGGAKGHSTIELGTYSAFGLDVQGGVALDLEPGSLKLGGELNAAGGAFNLALDYSGDGAGLSLSLSGAQADARLAPLLGELHPVFSGLEKVEGAALDGLLDAKLSLRIDGPIDLAGLAQGFDLSRVRGEGSLSLSQAHITGSPLLAKLLSAAGRPAETPIDMAPIAFHFDGKRLSYREPWTWRIGGIETRFTGGVGVDGKLDMAWEIPITEAMIAKHGFLEGLAGRLVSVPLGGTLTAPKLDWKNAFKGLTEGAAKEALRDELEGLIDKKLPGADKLGAGKLDAGELGKKLFGGGKKKKGGGRR